MCNKLLKTIVIFGILIAFLSIGNVFAASKEIDFSNDVKIVETNYTPSDNSVLSTPALFLRKTDENAFNCDNPNIIKAVKIIAEMLLWVRIIVPIIIIITGMINFAKAVLNQDDTEIRDVFYALMKKIFIGALIYFIPTIVIAVLKMAIPANKGSVNTSFDTTSSLGKCIELLK